MRHAGLDCGFWVVFYVLKEGHSDIGQVTFRASVYAVKFKFQLNFKRFREIYFVFLTL